MDLTTTYMGLKLKSPLVASASPLMMHTDNIRKMEDAGAAAVVLNSLYEEQIRYERESIYLASIQGTESFAEAITYLPQDIPLTRRTDDYLDQIRRAREAVDIPVIASLNGMSMGGWTSFAQKMEQAGANALELNIYYIPTQMNMTGDEVEQTYIDILRAVRKAVHIPLAVKLSPFFSNMANTAKKIDQTGVNALVLFNRFYQPDIDIETLEVVPKVILSTSGELRLPLTWIGILYGRIQADLAATTGIHTAEDVIKVVMAGAHVAMMTSAVLQHGISHFRTVEHGLRDWMTEHEYQSITQMRGSVSQVNSPDPGAFERAQYMKTLTTYRPEHFA
jgi:dihydroorotate dehydrogenase (fumarate)